MTSFRIPYRFDAVRKGSSSPLRVNRTVEVHLPEIEECERKLELSSVPGMYAARLHEGRIYLPVLRRTEGPPIGSSDLADLAEREPTLRLDVSLSTAEFDVSWKGDRKRLEKMLTSGEVDLDEAALAAEDRARRSALRDAQDLLVIGGVLHSCRNDPQVTIWKDGIHWNLCDSRPDPFSRHPFDRVPFSTWKPSEKAGLFGLADPAGRRPNPWENHDPWSEILEARPVSSFRDFDHSVVQLVRRRVSSVFPEAGNDCVVGGGSMGRADVPEALAEHAFEGRRLLRRIPLGPGRDLDVEPMLADVNRWLAEGEEIVAHLHSRMRIETRHLETFSPRGRERLEEWWREIERPRRIENAHADVQDEDLDAIATMRI